MTLRSLIESTKRITTSGGWVPEVDGIRFLAILLVLVNHTHERVIRRVKGAYPDIIDSGWDIALGQGDVGVLVFFALSGYILAKSLVPSMDKGEKVSIGRYYIRRLTRLEPPYLIALLGVFVLLSVTGVQSQFAKSLNEGASSLSAAFGASAIYSYGFIYGKLPKLNPPAWSLEVEVQFYVLVPLIAWLLTRARLGMRTWILGLALLVWSLFLSPLGLQNPHLRKSLLVYFPYFAIGLVVVDLESMKRGIARFETPAGRRLLDVTACVSLLILMFGGFAAKFLERIPVRTLLSGVFLFSALHSDLVRRTLQRPFIAVIGGMCYSIYLIHLPVLEALSGFTVKAARFTSLPYVVFLALQFVLLIVPVLGVSFVFYKLIEQPCMDRHWPAKLVARARTLLKGDRASST